MITEQDTRDSSYVALINKTMATQLWPNQDPLGKRIKFPGSDKNPQPWRTIVGTVSDVSQYALDKTPPMQIYLPHNQFPTSLNSIVVRTQNEPTAMIGAIRREIQAVDKDQAVFNVTTLEQLIGDSILIRRFFMLLLLVFAVLALILAAVGIYGVMSYVASQRTYEIGIRMALGAQTGQVIGLVMRDGLGLAAVGIVLGLAGAAGAARLIQTLLFDVRPLDPIVYAGVALLFTIVSALACLLPSMRAARIDPLIALRNS